MPLPSHLPCRGGWLRGVATATLLPMAAASLPIAPAAAQDARYQCEIIRGGNFVNGECIVHQSSGPDLFEIAVIGILGLIAVGAFAGDDDGDRDRTTSQRDR